MKRMSLGLLAGLCLIAAQHGPATAQSAALGDGAGLALWAQIHEVFAHPRCSNCHVGEDHIPLWSGAPHWALPPIEMQWAGRSSREICEQIKNPAKNGQRTLGDVADHVGHDALVLWGWNPGPGREPAPYSAAELVGFILRWDALGAPCPAE